MVGDSLAPLVDALTVEVMEFRDADAGRGGGLLFVLHCAVHAYAPIRTARHLLRHS